MVVVVVVVDDDDDFEDDDDDKTGVNTDASIPNTHLCGFCLIRPEYVLLLLI